LQSDGMSIDCMYHKKSSTRSVWFSTLDMQLVKFMMSWRYYKLCGGLQVKCTSRCIVYSNSI